MQEDLICPYPGLRPFNEDEAIFFKGRDEHIEQITRQLEEKKFLMLTGASGDGKSSLVYAGLIPNARAGFFKAKFGNWIVVDFRPERSPLKNLADALSDKFGAAEKERFQNELKFGFSALIDIYTQSPYYVNKNSVEFLSLEEAEKKKATRKGANLMILVDQFEEFFTNTENYSNGKTSVDSQLVVNLILETSRIALEKDIPIYVICTMRSDYIGQCASFRGLPEAIGFSQFFVPRLKRNEIYQVIQEPALLNGNKISKRLIEVLINEMNDGIDQLPVLQHALNQIWQIADKGKIEMDLIHFAKIGGLATQYLTKEDQTIFEKWFQSVPEYKKRFFEHPSLDNVLDGHANDLYYRAYDYLKAKQPDSKITIEDTQLIIRNSFKCLTKIDQSRGVRNRMTLDEIVNIIDLPHIQKKEVADVLEIFRLQGNTFLKPFYTEGAKENDLHSDSVLDITHESLIRNWSNLIEWANEEDEDYHIWEDFEKQLQRWIENDKSVGYLLPIGPLNFFETWMTKKNPNKYWLVKYDISDASPNEKLSKADSLLKNAQQFIKKSSRKLFVSKTILKYGAERIAIILSTTIVIFSCIFLYFDYASKENKSVLEASEKKGLELLKSQKVKSSTKAQFILLYENSHPGTIVENLKLCGNDSLQIRIAIDIHQKIEWWFTEKKLDDSLIVKSNNNIKLKLIEHIDNLLKSNKELENDTISLALAKRFFWFASLLNNGPRAKIDSKYLKHYVEKRITVDNILFEKFLKPQILSGKLIKDQELFNAIVAYLNSHQENHEKIRLITENISPFENEKSKKYFNTHFPKKSSIGNQSITLKYNGGFELLANCYAYLDESEKVFKCIDSIMKYDFGYNNRWMYGMNDVSAAHWIGSKDSTHQFIINLAEKKQKKFGGNTEFLINYFSYKGMDIYYNPNSTEIIVSSGQLYSIPLSFNCHRYCSYDIFNWAEKRVVKNNDNTNEANFFLSLIQKERTFNEYDSIKNQKLLERFRATVNKIDKPFLEDSILIGNESSGKLPISRKFLVFYPSSVDLNETWAFTNNWSYANIEFLNLLNDWKIFENYSFQQNELEILLKNALNTLKSSMTIGYFELENKYKKIKFSKIKTSLDFIRSLLAESNNKEMNEEYSSMMKIIDILNINRIDTSEIRILSKAEEEKYFSKNYFKGNEIVYDTKLNILKLYQFNLILNGNTQRALDFLNNVESYVKRTNLKFDLMLFCLKYGMLSESILIMKNYIQELNTNKRVPPLFFQIVGALGGHELINYSFNLIRESNESKKPTLTKYLIKGMASSNEYFSAINIIPTNISSNSELEYINEILLAEFRNNNQNLIDSWYVSNYWSDQIYETESQTNFFIEMSEE